MAMTVAFALLLVWAGDSPLIPHLEKGLSTPQQEERERILAHGPWPPALRKDPSNRVSGKPEAIAFGEKLFFEPGLSGTGSVLCATCHVPYRRFQDSRERAFGLQETARNTPTLLDVAFYPRYGWEGVRDTLWSQSIRPLLEPREMRSSPSHIGNYVRTRAAKDYEAAFGRRAPDDDEQILLDVGKALAAYQETLVSRRTPFDEYRDALSREDAAGMRAYPVPAQRGLRIFVGRCSSCHAGPTFSSGAVVRGIRIPALRNVVATAPYMHDGRIATLREALRHEASSLSAEQIDDLVAFLESLNSD